MIGPGSDKNSRDLIMSKIAVRPFCVRIRQSWVVLVDENHSANQMQVFKFCATVWKYVHQRTCFFLRVNLFSVLHKSDISEANAGGKSNPGAKIPLFRQYFRITLAAPNVFPSMLREPRPVLQENFYSFVSLIWPSFSGLVFWLEMRALTEYGKHILTFGKIEFCILQKSLQNFEYILAALSIICELPFPF